MPRDVPSCQNVKGYFKHPTFNPIIKYLQQKYSLLTDMWGRHQFLDEVIQPHFPLLDEGCK